MRFLRVGVVFFALLIILLSAGSASASTVSMTFVGVGGANGGGVYTYPYYFKINGGPNTALICDSFDNRINPPTQWTANVYSLLTAGSHGYFTDQTAYDAAGMIFEAMLTGAINSVRGNWAIWGLFSSTARSNSYYTSSGASTLESQYLAIARTDIANGTLPGYLANMVIYTPVGGRPGVGPQEFIGVVPEPGSLALFGSGLALLGSILRKRFSTSSC